MNRPHIPHDALIFIGDGRKALFLRNDGDEKYPNFMTEQVFEDDNPPTHEQGSERPGRIGKAIHSGRRSAVETADWHRLEEDRFVRSVAAEMERLVRSRKTKAVVVVAPPHTLAELRNTFHDDVKARIVAELDRDLTKHSVGEIEQHLTGG